MADNTDDLIISISTDTTTIKRALTKLVGDIDTASSQISRKFDNVGKSLDNSVTTALQARVNAMVGIGTKGANEWTGALADQGKQLDALRAKYSPLFATISQYKSSMADLKRAYAVGAISSAEFTAAQSRERQATLASIAAIKGRNTAIEQSGPGRQQRSNGNGFQTANIAAQFQDIAVTSAMGMNPLQIALQQGTQLSMALGSGEGGALASVKALGAGFLSIISPISLVTIGLVAGAAALIEYFSKSHAEIKTMDDALKAHTDSVDLLKEAYHRLGDEIKVSLSLGGNSGVDAILRNNELVMRAVARQQTEKFSSTLTGNNTWGATLTGDTGTSIKSLMKLPGDQAQFQPAVDELLQSARNGAPDLDTFNKSVDKTFQLLVGASDNPTGLQATADAVKLLGENALTVSSTIKVLGENGKETSQSLTPFQAAIDRLKVGIADGHPDLSQFNDDIEAIGKSSGLQSVADQVIILGRELLNLNIQLKELDARKAALFNDQGQNGQLLSQGKTNADDMGSYAAFQTQQRIAASRSRQAFAAQQAGINARSPYERANAARQAAAAQYSNDETPDARKQRIQQAGMLVEIQIQHDLTEAQRDRAVALNKTVEDQKLEVSLIGKTAGETAALRKEYELTSQLRIDAAKNGTQVDQKEIELIKQKSQELGKQVDAYNKANLNKDLSFERDQLFRSPQEQQVASRLQGAGLAVDPNSPEAKQIRQNLQIAEMQDTVKGFFTSIRDNVVSNGGNIGKALGDSIKTSMLNALTKAGDAAIQRLTNALVNAFLPSGNAAGGGASGGIVAAGTNIVSAITGKAPVGAVTRSPLPDVGATTDIASYISRAALKRGIDPSVALAVAKSEGGLKSWNMQSGVFKNGVQEPSFGPFQLYKGGGLGNAFQKQTGLDPALAQNGPAGVDFALDHASKNGWGSWYGARNTGISNWQGIGTGGATDATKALDKLAGSAGEATKGLGSLGTGLGQIGSSLSGAFPAAPSASGGGGIFGLLGGLFSSPFKAMGPQGAAALAGTLKPGLFADGGYTGPGSKNTPAGIVHAGEYVIPKHIVDKIGVPALSTMMRGYAEGGLVTNARMSAPRSPSLSPRTAPTGANSNQPGILNVHIVGASGDDHVRTLVKQGVGEGLNQYNDSQVRGGFGTNQNRWTARKG